MAKSNKTATPAVGGNRLYIILGVIVLVAVAGYLVIGRGGGAGATQPVALEADPAEIQRAQGVAMGQDDAPVLLYEFADFQCPACMQFSTFAHPLIKERLVDEGIVRFVRYDFPIITSHPHAFLAARAARCAGEQDLYWEYHDVLYGRQSTWSPQRAAPTDEFVDYAQLLGMNVGEFEQCLRSDRYAEEVTRNLQLGESLGVRGTPTLMINGQLVQVRDYNELERRVLEAAGQNPPAAEGAAGAAISAPPEGAGG